MLQLIPSYKDVPALMLNQKSLLIITLPFVFMRNFEDPYQKNDNLFWKHILSTSYFLNGQHTTESMPQSFINIFEHFERTFS